jgi:zinc/manganese transport system permease protein
MMEGLEFMLLPFIACLTLIGIHGYFGIHVLKRGIIFIDIAMAQLAALGMTFAYVFHIPEESIWTYPLSLLFVTLAAWFFAKLKCQQPRVCMEAIIGMTYAVAATAAVILIDKAAGSHEHLKEIFIGSILWVQWPEIVKSLIVYTLVGVFHYFFRNRLIPLSEDYEAAKQGGHKVQWWDFIFYFTLGIVVMHSVRIGGILLVFAFLIIPASVSALYSKHWITRISIGWLSGTLVSIVGLYLSWTFDLPSGPAVVLVLGLLLIMSMAIRALVPRHSQKEPVPISKNQAHSVEGDDF